MVKLKYVSLNGDYFHTHFTNTYISIPDPTNASAVSYTSGGDSVTQGFEGEATVNLTHNFSFYINGTEEAWNQAAPKTIGMILSGHIHLFEFLTLNNNRPPQLVAGTGGTQHLRCKSTRPRPESAKMGLPAAEGQQRFVVAYTREPPPGACEL